MATHRTRSDHDMAQSTGNTPVLNIHFHGDEVTVLRKLATEQGLTVANMIRKTLSLPARPVRSSVKSQVRFVLEQKINGSSKAFNVNETAQELFDLFSKSFSATQIGKAMSEILSEAAYQLNGQGAAQTFRLAKK